MPWLLRVFTLNVVEPFMSSLVGWGFQHAGLVQKKVSDVLFCPKVPFYFKSNVLTKKTP
ncbi:MAG: hypothetical protein CM15mP62_21800 [Rhodospirillaceae bacterium]|nr:MAG: hypothetical protein CM15mP62_21800 [Rhodospirillaceae bacterium]